MSNLNPHFFGTLFQSNNGLSMFLYPSQNKTNIYFEIFFPIEYALAFNMNITQFGTHVSPFNLNIVKTSYENPSIKGSPKNINAITMTTIVVDPASNSNWILKIEGTIGVPWTTIARMNPSQWIAIYGPDDKYLLDGLVAVFSNIQDATSFMFFDVTRATELKSGDFSVVIPLDDKHADGIHPGNFFVTSHLTNNRYELDVFSISGKDIACGWRVSESNLWSDSTHSGIYFNNGWMQPIQQKYFIGHNGLTEEQCSFVPFLDILDITNYFNSSNPKCEATYSGPICLDSF